jgi:hypothetical protein
VDAVGGEEWRRRVQLAYLEKLREDEGRASGMQRLHMTKAAIRQVSFQVAREGKAKPKTLTAADKLAWAMRFIRAVERGDWRRSGEARAAFPTIGGRIGGTRDQEVLPRNLERSFHGWILELAKDSVTEEVMEVQKLQNQGDECGVKRAKENVINKLKRIHGGATETIKAMRSDKGEVRTDSEGILEVLQSHWKEVFKMRGVHEETLSEWLDEIYPSSAGPEQERKRDAEGRASWRQGLPTEASGRWEVKKGDLARAVKQSKNSAPGPDGIPHKAWKELGAFGISVLWDAMGELHDPKAEDILREAYGKEQDFNAGIMVCLPKSATGTTDEGLEIFEAANTRPLSIGNTDNRLMCSAARIRWEGIFGGWVSPAQKGFLKGRSMLSNVVKVDHEAMRISLTHEYGGVVLFDFRAAFPSIERVFLFRSLRWRGRPEKQLQFIRMIYQRTVVRIRAAGSEGGSFEMTRGIRQGCPLSPLLFAVVVDILLRRLDKVLDGRGICRAFADDTAAVLQDLFGMLPKVATLFEEYAKISGLYLNISKTIVIPLWRHQERKYEDIKEMLKNLNIGWEGILVKEVGKYLGFQVGPGRGDAAWGKAVEKWRSRARSWERTALGLQYGALRYNTMCASVLLMQLLQVPPAVLEQELGTMTQLAKGPTAWANSHDLADGQGLRHWPLVPLPAGQGAGGDAQDLPLRSLGGDTS